MKHNGIPWMSRKAYKVLSCLIVVCLSVCSLHANSIKYKPITTVDGLADNHVMYVEQMPDKRMMVVTQRTVNLYDGGNFVIIPREDQRVFPIPHYTNEYRTYTDRKGILWIKEWGRLWCVNLHTRALESDYKRLFEERSRGKVPDCSEVCDVFFDKEKHLWLLTERGLWNAAEGKLLSLTFPAREVVDMARYGDTLLLFLANGSIEVMESKSGKSLRRVDNSCTKDMDIWGFHFLSTKSGRVYCVFDGKKSYLMEFNVHTLTYSTLVESEMILYGINALDEHHIGIGTRHGLLELDLPTGETFGTEVAYSLGDASPIPASISAVCPARFYGTFHTTQGDLTDVVVNAMCRDYQGGVWLAINDMGLLYAHTRRNRFHTATDYGALHISPEDALQLHKRLVKLYDANKQQDPDCLETKDGSVWHATHNGIYIVKEKDTLHLTTRDGLPGNHIISLVQDRKGTVWVATNNGIAEVVKASGEGAIIRTYGEDDGVPHWGFLYSSSLLLGDGRVAMQAQQGWMAFTPDSVQRTVCVLPPVLVRTVVNGCDTVTFSNRLRFTYQQNNLEFVFSTFNYAFPRQVSYRWRVNGGDWQRGAGYTDEHGLLKLSFMQLSPGTYTLEVQSTNDGVNYSEASTPWRITVTPPWWQTWWAYTLYVLLGVALLTGIFATYLMAQRNRLEWKRKEEVLQLQIRHLLEQASVAPIDQEMEQEAPEEETTESVDENPYDNAFVQRAVSLIEEHLEQDYTVEQLARDLCMERTGLYKRLTALVNQSPQRFIRSVRIHRAQEMLRTTDLSVTEICYKVGFSSTSYMSRCFVEDVGVKPTEYRENQTKST